MPTHNVIVNNNSKIDEQIDVSDKWQCTGIEKSLYIKYIVFRIPKQITFLSIL